MVYPKEFGKKTTKDAYNVTEIIAIKKGNKSIFFITNRTEL